MVSVQNRNVKSFIFVLLLVVISSCQFKSVDGVTVDAIIDKIKEPHFSENKLEIKYQDVTGDSLKDFKPLFEKSILKLKELGGGTLLVDSGIYYLKGPIHLSSGINLHLSKGAVVKFSSYPKDYLPVVLTSWEGTLLYNYSPFIYAYQAENIAITGEGTIDGEASDTWQEWKKIQTEDQMMSREMNHKGVPVNERVFGDGHYLRPHLIQFFECKNILVEGITIEDSPFWCLHLLKCENAVLRGLNYHAYNKNNDGIDPEYSKNILIENIHFDNGDDNVAIKAGRDNEGRNTNLPSENIVIRNCSFKGLHAVVIGSEMSSGVRNVFVQDCTYGGYLKRGIYLKSNPDRGGYIKNIFVKNVNFGEVEDCFYITSYYHQEGKGNVTDISEIYLENISCNKANGTGIVIQGFPEKKVRNVYLNNVTIDSAVNAISLVDADNVIMSNVIIGSPATPPSYIQ